MKQYLCIGTYTEEILFGTGELFHGKGRGVSIAGFEEGNIEVIQDMKTINPSYLCVDEACNTIYTVNETKEYLGKTGGGATQLSYDADGYMEEVASYNVEGTDPCHIVKSPDGHFLAVSNFASGDVTILYLDEYGNMTGEMEVFHHNGSSIHPVRQKGPHAHSAIFTPDGRYMYVPDLGIDCVKAYTYNNGRVMPAPEADIKVPAGSGPRFGEFHVKGTDFYLICELSSQVMHFKYEAGHMLPLEIVETLPKEFTGDNICSDLHLAPNGKYLYASNRGHDSIVCYRISDKGALEFVERISSGGRTPRNFCIAPLGDYILVGNQDSDNITVFSIQENGTLVLKKQVPWGSPVCIRFFDFK